MQVVFASLCREPCARLHEEAGLAGRGAHRLDRDAHAMARPSPIQAEPNSAKRGRARAKTIQENGLVFLGFPSPFRAFSMTCADPLARKYLRLLSPFGSTELQGHMRRRALAMRRSSLAPGRPMRLRSFIATPVWDLRDHANG